MSDRSATNGAAPAAVRSVPVPRLDDVIANTLSEKELRAFYDPAGRFTDEPVRTFLDRVASTRQPMEASPLGPLTEFEIILAEGLHAGIDKSIGVGLPVPAARQHAIADWVNTHAERVAVSVIEVADRLADDTAKVLRMLHLGSLRPPGRVVHAGRVLAAVAHEGCLRRSGRDYFMHPDEVASIITTAWQRQMGAEDERLDLARFLAYAHDGFEDTIDPFGAYLSNPVIVSPLVARTILELVGVPDAGGIARILLLMTRTKDADGNRMDYLDYIERGVRQGGLLFLLTKAPDLHHNLNIEPDMIDPTDHKARAKYEKRETYRAAADEMRIASEDYDSPEAWVVHSVFTVAPSDLKPSTKSDSLSLQETAAAVKQRVAELV